jgi:hypothetical protein
MSVKTYTELPIEVRGKTYEWRFPFSTYRDRDVQHLVSLPDATGLGYTLCRNALVNFKLSSKDPSLRLCAYCIKEAARQ